MRIYVFQHHRTITSLTKLGSEVSLIIIAVIASKIDEKAIDERSGSELYTLTTDPLFLKTALQYHVHFIPCIIGSHESARYCVHYFWIITLPTASMW